MRLQMTLLDPGLPSPSYAHPGDAGLDLAAARAVTLKPGQRAARADGRGGCHPSRATPA